MVHRKTAIIQKTLK